MTTLAEFLTRPGAPSAPQFAAKVGLTSDGPVRQWAKGVTRPHVEFAAAVEQATGGEVRRWTMYPESWWRVWPELVGAAGAPPVPPPVGDGTGTNQAVAGA
jgi:DNA-binding transcriptional regulator YdaS (Cro superfamily)